jgi:hypothetical protein
LKYEDITIAQYDYKKCAGMDLNPTDLMIFNLLCHWLYKGMNLFSPEMIIKSLPAIRIKQRYAINRKIKKLIDSKLITLSDDREIIASHLKIKNTVSPTDYWLPLCLWCGKESMILEDHHYPVSKSSGGNETVKICPNCHRDFHMVLILESVNERLILK